MTLPEKLTKSGHCHVPIDPCNHRVQAADLQLPLHYRTLPATEFITRLALWNCRNVSINGLYITRCMTLPISSLRSVSNLNGLIYTYILSFLIIFQTQLRRFYSCNYTYTAIFNGLLIFLPLYCNR
jgi:hypothetical protein